jgi:hypothetical protein
LSYDAGALRSYLELLDAQPDGLDVCAELQPPLLLQLLWGRAIGHWAGEGGVTWGRGTMKNPLLFTSSEG